MVLHIQSDRAEFDLRPRWKKLRMTFSARCLVEIRVGSPHGGDGGVAFNDLIDLDLSMTTPCIGVELFWYRDYLFAARFIYAANSSAVSKIYHGDPFARDPPLTNETFMMQPGERINKVTWYAGEHGWTYRDKLIRFVRGIQFFTSAGRRSKLYGTSAGDVYTESFDGFTLGPVTGKSATLIDQLQFTWIKRGE